MGKSTTGTVRSGRLAMVVCLVASALVIPAVAAGAAQNPGAYEVCLVDAVNDARQSAGIAPLTVAGDLVPGVRQHSAWMSDNEFQHMSRPQQEQILPDTSQTWGENIAWTSDFNASCSVIHNLLMNSSGHRANILNPGFEFLALGAHIDGSGTWVTQLFFRSPGYTPSWAGGFWDEDSSVFEAAIERLASAGITNGCNPPDNDRFCPDDYVTRGMMAAFLVRGLNLPNGGGIDFVDDNRSTFESAIEKLAAAGITSGCNPPANDRFCPGEYVTRGMMAAFLARGLNLPNGGGTDFVDDNGSIFESAIESLAAAGITKGCNPPSNDRFCPDDYVTRGMMAAFLVRGLGL